MESLRIVEAPELSMATVHSKKGYRSNMLEWIETLVSLMLRAGTMGEWTTIWASSTFLDGLRRTVPDNLFRFRLFRRLVLRSDSMTVGYISTRNEASRWTEKRPTFGLGKFCIFGVEFDESHPTLDT